MDKGFGTGSGTTTVTTWKGRGPCRRWKGKWSNLVWSTIIVESKVKSLFVLIYQVEFHCRRFDGLTIITESTCIFDRLGCTYVVERKRKE